MSALSPPPSAGFFCVLLLTTFSFNRDRSRIFLWGLSPHSSQGEVEALSDPRKVEALTDITADLPRKK